MITELQSLKRSGRMKGAVLNHPRPSTAVNTPGYCDQNVVLCYNVSISTTANQVDVEAVGRWPNGTRQTNQHYQSPQRFSAGCPA